MEHFFLVIFQFLTSSLWQGDTWQAIAAYVIANPIKVFASWFFGGIGAILLVYVGFGFAMAATRARNEGKTQRLVVYLDYAVVIPFFALDIIVNMVFIGPLMLDLRPKYWFFRTITARCSRYNEDPKEYAFRKWLANFFAALLDGKDVKGDHIRGDNLKFGWLD